ncbi:MAG TPA: FkbM family methyltransferase, partial [Methylococcales bacterium]
FLRDDADESVVAEIFKWREYKAAEEVIEKISLPILDVGAHIGIFSLYARAINPTAKIYAMEPEKENFGLLLKNIEANDLKDVKSYKVALSSKTAERNLAIELDSINHHLADENFGDGAEAHYIKVPSISLRDFLEKNDIARVGLLKMDIESGEYEVLENMQEEVFGRIDNIILEYHNYGGRNYKELEDILRENGFTVQRFPSGFEKDLGFLFARNKRHR